MEILKFVYVAWLAGFVIFTFHTVINMIFDGIKSREERAKFRKKFMTDFDRKNVKKMDEMIAEMKQLKKTIGGY